MIPAIQEIGFGPGTDKAYATLHQATVSFAEMGERTISTQVRIDGDVVPDFDGWEVSFKGERFILNTKDPQAVKDNSTRNSLVDLTFVSWVVNELKRYFFFEPTSIDAGTAIADKYKASVNVPVEDFAVLFNKVLDYYFDGKVVFSLYMSGQGQYSTDRALVEIDYTYIWDVLVKFFEIYGVRWRIEYDSTNDVYTIKAGWPTTDIDINDHDFEYGYKGGLLRFERQVQDVDIHNILLGRGGEKNIPYRYFKRVDPQNPDWAADPDAIPELSNIYFDRLRDINFRWYVRGWMQNPNHDTSWEEGGYVYPTYTIASDSPYYFAYQKGLTDEKFNPVEYVKDDESIADYGEHWGALDDNDDIFPTIQGVTRAPLGRIDEAVAVSEIVTDDIDAMAQNAAIEKSINRLTLSLNGDTETVFDRQSEEFTIPSGSTGNVTYVPIGTDEVNPGLVRFDTDNSTVVAVANGVEYPIDAIPAGTYRLKLHMVIARSGQATSATGTFGIENIILTTSSMDTDAWKPTFDIWVKNIWGTTKGQDENDIQYAERVWLPILGDRAGNEAKIVFSSGFMSVSEDYEFTIVSYPVYDTSKSINGVPSEWRITLRKSDAEFDATGLYIPNASTGGQPIAGDKFFFIGIDMPFRYVELAEEDLNTNKTAQLDTEAAISPTWIMNLDKVRVHTLEDQEYGQTLADRLAAGGKVWIKDKRFTPGQRLQLYVQSITYTWNEPSDDSPYIVPDIEVVLSDKVVAVDSIVQRIQSDVSSIKNQYARISDVEAVVRSVAEPIFLKKTGESDSSDSPTQFSSKVTSKGFRQGAIGGTGWGIYRDNTSAFAADENEQPVQTRGTRSLRALRANVAEQEEEADAVIEADRIVVRKELQVNSLVINQIAYVGGKEIISAAKIEVSKVIETANGYICYFDQRRNSVANNFAVNDIAFGQVFNPDNTEQRYYKMVVTATDVDCITLGKSPKDGSGVPKVGDIIVQYGNTTNVDRQYVIVRDVIGGGYERMLSGLSSVSSTGKEYYFAGRQNNSGARWFVGDALGDYAEYEDGVLTIKANVIFKAGQEIPGMSELSGEVSELSGDVDEMSQELIAFNQALGGLTTDVDALEYLKTALPKSDTIIAGGLILSKVIALRDSNSAIKSGINGDPSLSSIAAWYGGPMADKEATPTPASYAQSLFRFDGSGYLAGGNIFWNNQGYGGIPGVTWSRINGQDVVSIGANVQLESLQGADSSVTDLIDAVNSLADLFEVVNGNVHVKNNRGFYSDSFISAGGLSSGGGTAGGNASMQLISGGGRITNGTDTLDVYSMSKVDQLLASAGTVQTVAGVSPVSGDIPVASLQTALSLGAAAYKAVGSVASGNTGLVTGGDVYSAINEAVSSVLKMQGTTTTAISDGSTTNPVTINGSSYTAKKGDVVMYGNKEFWWTGSAWEELGDEASWALKTTTISAGTGLTGGGTLASNRTISLSDSTIASLALADTALQSHQTIYALTIKNSAGTNVLSYTPNSAAGSLTLTKAMVGLGNVDNTAAADYFTVLENSSNQISLTIGGTNKKLTVAYATKALQDSAGNQISTYYLPKATFDDMFEKVALSGGGYAIKAKYGLYTDQFLSAGGLSTGGGAAGGDTSMVVSGNVATFTSSSATFQTYSKNYIDNAISGAGSVGSIKLGTVEYTPDTNKVVNLPAYPTSLPASDVSAWAKASTKPSYAFSEITGTATISQVSGLQTALDAKANSTALANYLPLTGGTLTNSGRDVLTLNQNTSSTGQIGSYIRFKTNDSNSATVGYNSAYGAFLSNESVTNYPFVHLDNSGVFKLNNNQVFLHSGNYSSYLDSVYHPYGGGQIAFTASTITASSAIFNTDTDKQVRIEYGHSGANIAFFKGSTFHVGSINASPLLLNYEGAGNVGIGTESPSAKLHIKGHSIIENKENTALGINTSTYLIGHLRKDIHIIENASTGTGVNDGYISSITFGNTTTASFAGIYVQSSGGYGTRMIFGTTSSFADGAYGRVIITSAGDVGIGTMTPACKLDVAGNTRTSGKLYIGTSGAYLEYNATNGVHLVVPSGKGFYTEGFISAGGVSSSGGSGGIDADAMWGLLANTDSSKKINIVHIPDLSGTYAVKAQANNFVHSLNEWTVIPSEYSGNLWLNYRTVGGTNGSLTTYSMGNGAGGYASITASSFIKSGGTSSQFLKADGSVDSNTYLTTSSAASAYVLKYIARGHGSQSNSYTGPTYLSGYVGNNAIVERGSWAYASNGYIDTGVGVIGLAGTMVVAVNNGANGSAIFVTPSTSAPGSGTGANNEMFFFTQNGNNSSYPDAWTRVMTNRNFSSIIGSTYVKTSGDTISGTLTINQNDTPLNLYGGTDSTRIAFYTGDNTWRGYVMYGWGNLYLTAPKSNSANGQLGISNSMTDPYWSPDNGTTKYNLWHSGNSGTSTTSWACSTLTANSTVTGNAFKVSATGQTTSGLYGNSAITSAGEASTLWLYNNAAIKILGSSVDLNCASNGSVTISGYTAIHSGNYTSYVNSTNFPGLAGVRSVSINGNYLRVNTNGTNADLTVSYATQSGRVTGSYTQNGGQQNPNYFGKNKVGFLMMNTTVNGNSHYKDWIIMDCYAGSDVGGGVAIGVNREALGAYIMRSAAARDSWAASAELLGTHNYSSYALPLTGGSICSATNYARLRLVTDTDYAYIQAGTKDAYNGSLYISGYNATVGANLYLKFSNVYAYNGSSFSSIWHAGNSNKSDVSWTCSTLTASVNSSSQIILETGQRNSANEGGGIAFWKTSYHFGEINASILALNPRSGGSVAIGKSAATSGIKLDVNGDIHIGTPGGTGTIGTPYSSSDGNHYNYITFSSGTGGTTPDILYCGGAWTSGDHISHQFKTWSDATALVIRNNGYIGIGTSTPAEKLYIIGKTVIDKRDNTALGINTSTYLIGHLRRDIHIMQNAGTGSGVNDGYVSAITFGNATTASYAGIYMQSSGQYGTRLIFGTTHSYANGVYARVIITHVGNVGIGTMSPSYKLHVAGDIVATGAITAGSASDRALKTNISTLSDSDAKALIMALRPVTFTWNDKATELYDQYNGNDLGFVAQEVENVLPVAIGTIFEKYKRLDQTKFIAPLVAVAKDHETRIEKLEKEVKARDAKIMELESEIKRLRMN